MQRGQLAVEMAAQARELVGVGQFRGLHRFVEFLREGAVGRRPVVAAVGRNPGFALGRGLVALAFGRVLGAFDLALRGLVGLRSLAAGVGFGVGVVFAGFAFALRLHAVVGLVFGFGVGVEAGRVVFVFVGEFEMGDQPPRGFGEGFLIVDRVGERFEVGVGAFGEPRAPQVAHEARGFGWGRSAQTFAGEQAEDLDDGRVGAVLDVLEALLLATRFHGGVEIVAHPRHAPRAERLATRLFEAIVDRLRDMPRRSAGAVQAVVVEASAQRQRVGFAPELPDFAGLELARRRGEEQAAGFEAGAVGGETRFRARGRGQGRAQRRRWRA